MSNKKSIKLNHRETNEEFGDGSHIIYVNGAYKNDEDPIGRLVHDFGCVRSADITPAVTKMKHCK